MNLKGFVIDLFSTSVTDEGLQAIAKGLKNLDKIEELCFGFGETIIDSD